MEKLDKITVGIFCVLIGIVLCINVTKIIINGDMKYTYATYKKTYDDIDTYGIFLREEEFLNDSTNDLTHLVVASGKKIANNDTIAVTYQDEKYLTLSEELEELYAQKSLLESITLTTQIDQNSTRSSILLNAQIATLSLNLDEGNFEKSLKDIEEVKNSLLKTTYSQMTTLQFSQVKNELNAQIFNIESQVLNQINKIISPKAGYFVYGIDGYENIQKEAVNVSFLENAYNSEISLDSSKIFGKIVTDFSWTLAVVVTNEEAEKIKNNNSIKLLFEDLSDKEILVETIDIVKEDDKSIVYFKSDFINEKILQTRITDVKIILNEYEGLQIPKEATRIKDGVLGVYSIRGFEVVFKKIDIILEKDDYYLIKFNGIDIINGDKVVTESKELLDDKIFK